MDFKKPSLESEVDCLVIAEAGVNHNGDLYTALKLVDSAIDCGATAIKFQTYKTEDLVIKKEKKHFDMLKKLELKDSDFIAIKEYCDKKGIIFLSTPHTEQAVDFLDPLVPLFKIGSGDITNIPLLQKVARKGKPIILSTGMATMEEIKEAITHIKTYNDCIMLTHCTTQYPCKRKDVNLGVMSTFQYMFNLPAGYSDHTKGIDIALMAADYGAELIEKHFTLNKKMKGPDHKASLNPKEFKELVRRIKNKDFPKLDLAVIGNFTKTPTKEEIKISKLVRKSIVTTQNIPKNTYITRKMLTTKRPGTGIHPRNIINLIGSKTKKMIKKDTILKMRDLE